MNEFISAAQKGNIAQVGKLLKSASRRPSNSDLWLAAQQAYNNKHFEVIKIIYKDNSQEAITDFKSRDFVETVKTGNLEKVKEWLKDPDMNPAAFENAALKNAFLNEYLEIVYELMELSDVREQLFSECKESLTMDQAKFLLYGFSEKIQDADNLYKDYINESNDLNSEETTIGFDSDDE